MGTVTRYTNGTTGGPVFVDVADGRIVRITPLVFDETDAPSWIIEARGRKLQPAAQNGRLALDGGPSVYHLLTQAHPDAAQARGLQSQRRPQHPEPRPLGV